MGEATAQAHDSAGRQLPSGAWSIVFIAFVLHFIVCITFDRTHPQAFEFAGDRADTRFDQIKSLIAAKTPAQFVDDLFSSGLPGDYLWHAGVFYLVGGLPYPVLWVITTQVLVWMAVVLVLGNLALRLGFGERAAVLSMVLYLLLPHSLVFPHLLVSEGFFVPLVLFATYCTVRWLQEPGKRFHIAAGVFWALAGLTRPEALLAPFVIALFHAVKRTARAATVAKFLAVYCALLAVWFVPSLLLTGSMNLSSQSPAQFSNILHRKGEFLILTLPRGELQREWAKIEEIPPTDFAIGDLLSLYARHPMRVVGVHAFELGKLLVRFDEIKILTYLGIWQPDPDWQRRFATEPLASFARENGPYIIMAVVGSGIWLVVLLFALRGFVMECNRPELQMILILVSYAFLSVLTVDNTSARLRSCTNYAFVLTAAIGYLHWRRQQPRKSRAEPPQS
jgi:4-amino-4-deoxy-L-arabinose transferase-like glycosyltransferase